MNNNKQKLELTWIGKGEEPRLEPRILIEDPEKSYGDPSAGNMLIHGDNLLALKALEQDFADKITCIYIDPPYNTGSAFEHYDDNLEHSTWLSLMKPRLEILRTLLHPTMGSIWISIDDDESHYLKVICDEVFGRANFVANVIWEKKYAPQNDARWLSDSHDHILVYARNKEVWRPYLLPRTVNANASYKNPDNDPRGPWMSDNPSVKTYSANTDFPITTPSGRVVHPPESRCWRFNKEKFEELVKDNRIWFGRNGNGLPRLKTFLSEVQEGMVSKTIWYRTEVGDNQEAKREIKDLFGSDVFGTPKPERLVRRILELATKPNNWVLDSFLGSGTTAAVAHKTNRKYIGIEFGEHASTHCQPRLKKVVDGKDGLALSEVLGWKGGGGFKFYDLAPSLLRQDKFGNWVIEEKYNAHMLAAAMAKQEGFHFEPDEQVFWKQAKSTEKDFLFTTTQFLTLEMLDSIHSEMQSEESLLIACKAYHESCNSKYLNVTIKKIPQILLGRCEYGKDDYSLNIINVPVEEVALESVESAASKPKRGKKKKA
jgi:adenine-specific DNA-methyltransferase